MNTRQLPTKEAFDKLLGWLDPDREKAAEKYQKIQARLNKIFAAKGCSNPEDLADETFNVVTRKIDGLLENYVGDPALYFYAVAKKIFLEQLKKKPLPELPPVTPDASDLERRCTCLEECLKQELTPTEQNLILRYHEKEKREKIKTRKQIALELGISINALRIKVYHFQTRLRRCIEPCLQRFVD